jgi:hypothetical protein
VHGDHRLDVPDGLSAEAVAAACLASGSRLRAISRIWPSR